MREANTDVRPSLASTLNSVIELFAGQLDYDTLLNQWDLPLTKAMCKDKIRRIERRKSQMKNSNSGSSMDIDTIKQLLNIG